MMYHYLVLLWFKQQSRTSELAAFGHSGNVFSEPSILKNDCGLLPTVNSDSRLLHEKSILQSIHIIKSFCYYFVFGISAKKSKANCSNNVFSMLESSLFKLHITCEMTITSQG